MANIAFLSLGLKLKREIVGVHNTYGYRVTMIFFQIEGTKGIQNQEKLHQYVK